MASLMAKALYNWMVGYRIVKGAALTREDYVNTWGGLGGAVYDWGNQLYAAGMGATVKDEASFEGMADQLAGSNPVGGAIGSMYQPAAPGTTPGAGGVGAAWGNLGKDMFRQLTALNAGRIGDANTGLSPAQKRAYMIQQYGELGGQMFDWYQGQMGIGNTPTEVDFASQADYMANIYNPGGALGAGYRKFVSPADQAALDKAKVDIENARKAGLLTDAQAAYYLAQAANQGKLTDAQIAEIYSNINKTNADMLANPRDWVKAWFYQRGQQPPATGPAAPLAPSGTPPTGVAGDDTTQGQTIMVPSTGVGQSGQTGDITVFPWSTPAGTGRPAPPGAAPAPAPKTPPAAPAQTPLGPRVGDTLQYQPTKPGVIKLPEAAGTVPTPPWLQNIAQNKPGPAFNASAGSLGTFPIKAPDPQAISAQVWNSLAPSEQLGAEGLASSSGWYWPDYIKKMFASQNRQPGISPDSITSFAGW